MIISFNKFHGAGNDFILLDTRNSDLILSLEQIKFLCNRRFGIGADGLITLGNDNNYPFFMRYYNSDGKESTMCGNGGRCISLFANQLGLGEQELFFNAIDGEHTAIILEKEHNIAKVKLKMKDVDDIEHFKGYSVLNTGSPHYVTFSERIENIDIKTKGHEIRYSAAFKAEGINVNFVEILKDEIFVRTYERGVEDETLSCGTGVTASVLTVSDINSAITSPLKVKTLGGNLCVHFVKEGKGYKDIWLEGPAEKVFTGSIEI